MSNVPLIVLMALLYVNFAGLVCYVSCRATPRRTKWLGRRALASRSDLGYGPRDRSS